MKGASRSQRLEDWVSRQLQGTLARNPDWGQERRHRSDRRSRHFWSVLYGSFNPRRRRPARRVSDTRFQPVDWYSAHLLAVSIGILLFSATDAFLTFYNKVAERLLKESPNSASRIGFLAYANITLPPV